MYKLSKIAAEDFAEIFEYSLVNYGTQQADLYAARLHKTLLSLSAQPFLGKEYSLIGEGIRRHNHQRHAIFYRPSNIGIFVIRLLHQRMEPLKYFNLYLDHPHTND